MSRTYFLAPAERQHKRAMGFATQAGRLLHGEDLLFAGKKSTLRTVPTAVEVVRCPAPLQGFIMIGVAVATAAVLIPLVLPDGSGRYLWFVLPPLIVLFTLVSGSAMRRGLWVVRVDGPVDGGAAGTILLFPGRGPYGPAQVDRPSAEALAEELRVRYPSEAP